MLLYTQECVIVFVVYFCPADPPRPLRAGDGLGGTGRSYHLAGQQQWRFSVFYLSARHAFIPTPPPPHWECGGLAGVDQSSRFFFHPPRVRFSHRRAAPLAGDQCVDYLRRLSRFFGAPVYGPREASFVDLFQFFFWLVVPRGYVASTLRGCERDSGL